MELIEHPEHRVIDHLVQRPRIHIEGRHRRQNDSSHPRELQHEPGISVQTLDTTGAGDIFRGAFIYALLRGDAPRDIVRFANAAAALSCSRVGAMSSIPSLEEIPIS